MFRQLLIVGFGRGKSRVTFGMLYLYLMLTNYNVMVVFSSRGLMERDEKEMDQMLDYLGEEGQGLRARVKFQVGIQFSAQFKPHVVIMDESDYTVFADLPKFYEAIKGKSNLKLIGLTAMATSCADGGSELKALELLDFEQFEMDNVADRVMLDTDRAFPIGDRETYRTYLWEQAMWKPLLVYAREPLYDDLT